MNMQIFQQKKRILTEARRLFAAGRKYGIHELCFQPDGMSKAKCREIKGEISKEIPVGVRPLRSSEWKQLLEH